MFNLRSVNIDITVSTFTAELSTLKPDLSTFTSEISKQHYFRGIKIYFRSINIYVSFVRNINICLRSISVRIGNRLTASSSWSQVRETFGTMILSKMKNVTGKKNKNLK